MDRTITLTDTRLEIAFPYTEGMVKRVKDLPLRSWDNDKKCWCLPRTATLAKLAIAFGLEHNFTIDGSVFTLADSKPKRVQVDRSVLRPYQHEAVDFAHQNRGTFLNADDLGLGKTLETLWYAREVDASNILVVCPASVLYKWQAEVERWIPGWSTQVILTSKQPFLPSRVTIMSYAILTRRAHELCKYRFELVVFDEAHALANQSKRTSAAKLVVSDKKIFLSGTPFLNRPIELFNILNMIHPMSFPNYWSYAQRYCDAQQVNMGGRKFWNVNGASNLDELKNKLDLIMIRRTRFDVAKDLPELTRNILPVDIDNKSEYRLAEMDLKNWLKLNGKTATSNALTKLNYLRQIMGVGKVRACIELAEEVLQSDPKRKLVIYAHHKEVVKQLLLALKEWGVETIVGDDSPQQRADTNKRFQEGQLPRVLIISSAGGQGIDLFRSDTMIFCEREWNPGSEEQAEGRIHRQGQNSSVSTYYLVARNTVDEKISDLIESKRKVFGTLIGSQDIVTEVLNGL